MQLRQATFWHKILEGCVCDALSGCEQFHSLHMLQYLVGYFGRLLDAHIGPSSSEASHIWDISSGQSPAMGCPSR